MGLFPSSFTDSMSGKQDRKTGIANTKVIADRSIKLPEEYKNTTKDICGLIRKCFEFQPEESIQEEVDRFCMIKEIEAEIFQDSKDLKYIPIRLYISTTAPKGVVSKLYSKIATITQDVGTAHLAIQIGNKVAHWFDSSFVFVKEWEGKNCLCIFYPQKNGEEIPMVENTEETRLKICQVIQKWNCTKVYGAMKTNCQNFASELFQSLGFDYKFTSFEGPVGEFFQYLGKYHSEKIYPCLIHNGEKIIEWKTHDEFDDWDKDQGEVYPKHLPLLKGFHRGFQVQGYGGKGCRYDAPTLLIGNDGNKLPVHEQSSYNSRYDSHMSGMNMMSGNLVQGGNFSREGGENK